MNKQIISIVAVVLVVLAAVGGFIFFKSKNKTGAASPTPTPVPQIINVPIEERPFITLTPRDDGKSITMTINRYGAAKKVEYELAYDSMGIPRGVIGDTNLSGSEFFKELLLGTCSRNVCRYDEGISKGEITLTFREDAGVKKFVSDFNLLQSDKQLGSADGKFTLTGKLSKTFYIVAPTVGLPGTLSGTVVEGPIGVFTTATSVVKQGKIVFVGQSDPSMKIFSWENNNWVEKTAKVEDGNLTASVDNIGIFVLVSPQ